MSESPQTLPSHGLERPKERDALASLTRIIGPEKAVEVWNKCREACGYPHHRGDLNLQELKQVADFLGSCKGVLKVAGRSLSIKISTFEGISNSRLHSV